MYKKITYSLEYNSINKKWVVFKNIETKQGFNFYGIYEDVNKKNCINKLKEVQK